MLSRLVLMAVQAVAGWFGAHELIKYLGLRIDKGLEIFLYAVIFSVIVWLVGVLAGLVLKDVARPSPSTLAFALVVALVLAAMTKFPEILTAIDKVVPDVPRKAFPLIGAVLGYAVKR